MPIEKPTRRLPLRDLLTDAEKRSRALAELLGTAWLARATDLRDLSRPVRKRSNYPTLLALQNSIQNMVQANQEIGELIDILMRELDEIHEHARRERLTRL